jgi:hypothetical protein
LGSTRLSDPTKPIPLAGQAERTTTSGSSVGSSSEVNSLAAIENLLGKLEEPEEIEQEIIAEETVDNQRIPPAEAAAPPRVCISYA